MYLIIRCVNKNACDITVNVNKNSLISEILTEIKTHSGLGENKIRLIYKGKQLMPECRVMDYDMVVNDIIQLFIKPDKDFEQLPPTLIDVESKYLSSDGTQSVLVRCNSYFAYWEAVIIGIKMREDTVLTTDMSLLDIEGKFIFYVNFINHKKYKSEFVYTAYFDNLRLPAREPLKFEDLHEDDLILVYIEEVFEKKYGYWYEFNIKEIISDGRKILGTALCDPSEKMLLITVKVHNNIFKLKKPELLVTTEEDDFFPTPEEQQKKRCIICKNNRRRKCTVCGCHICGLKNEYNQAKLCNQCLNTFHFFCVPGLDMYPREVEWYCSYCKTPKDIVLAGEPPKKRLKQSDKSGKVWGRGMACVGRTKNCTIVPLDHFGPIPGIDVGTRWRFRIQVSEAGVHRPPVYGIHGRENVGAFSLVMSGGYENWDRGKEFIYSGCGGKDNSNNRRTGGAQTHDQVLIKLNKALAMNCSAVFNDKKGATSKNWKAGKPVRVCRSYKLQKFSKFAPKSGIRYDGIYKVVRYFKERNKSGHLVWKFFLRRDDPTPAPWEKRGQEHDIIYPDGYLEAHASQGTLSESKIEESTKEIEIGESSKMSVPFQVPPKGNISPQNVYISLGPNEKGKGKSTKRSFRLEPEIKKLVEKDTENVALWDELKEAIKGGKMLFTTKLQKLFECVVCQEVVFKPVTTCPKHNTCHNYLQRSFESFIYQCSYCRKELGKNYKLTVNEYLSQVLLNLLPGYEQNRL